MLLIKAALRAVMHIVLFWIAAIWSCNLLVQLVW